MQLDKLLQSQGFGSRKACRALVRDRRVAIAGATVADPFAEVDPTGLEFAVDGAPWRWHEKAYLMLNKPAGFECSRAPIHHPSVFSLLPAPLVERGVQAVGRLDEDTTGLLLLSDDGQFIHRLASPKKGIAKVYAVTTRHPVDAELVTRLLAGVALHDEAATIAAAACVPTGEQQLELTITGGKYHQVKRMIAAAGNRVDALRRIAVGGLTLPADLAPGAWRWLAAGELLALEGQ
jgi:16S rRNA pseudouridine516 synthase